MKIFNLNLVSVVPLKHFSFKNWKESTSREHLTRNTKKYHVFVPMGRFQFESIYLYFPPLSQLLYLCFCPVNCPSQETEVTSTSTRPVDNVVIATKGLQDRNINIIAGTTVENKGKLIQTGTAELKKLAN